MLTATLFVLISWASQVIAIPKFRDRIPNGHIVPDPCFPNAVWLAVGHVSNHRGGVNYLNNFAIDFIVQKQKWTKALCQKDSDGDGRTNGQELGDPFCIWTNGNKPTFSKNLSHPGVCEPLYSSICRSRNRLFNFGNISTPCPMLAIELTPITTTEEPTMMTTDTTMETTATMETTTS